MTALPFTETGRGETVFLLHSFPADRRIWSDVAAILSQSFRVICPDLNGFGANKPTSQLSIALMAASVAALTRGTGGPAAVAGLSMGGYVAQQMARDFSDYLSRLILVDTKAAADTPQQRDARDALAAFAIEHGSAAVFDKMRPSLLGPDASDAAVAAARLIAEGQSPLTLVAALRAMRDRDDFSAFLPTAAMPVHLIFGKHDAMMPPAAAAALHATLPSATLTQIDGAGHLSPLEKPNEVAAAIAAALQSKH